MAELLTCSQCKGDFKDPRALPCLHIFCHLCLVELVDCAYEEDAVTCPICQKYHRIPARGVNGFQQNLPIKSFLKMIGQNEQRSPKITLCEQHPKLEADLLCLEYDCNGAVLCGVCVNENHRNHYIFPAKEVCTRKLAQLKMYKQALKQNNETLMMLKKRLERNKKEMKNEVSRRFSAILEHVAEQVEGDIDKKTYDQELRLLKQEDQLREAQSLLESLEFQFSDTIPIIIQANAERRLDAGLDKLHRLLEGWEFKYAMPVVQVDKKSKHFLPAVSVFGKIELREDVLKGSSVGSIEPKYRSLEIPAVRTQRLPLELPVVRTRRQPGQMAPICPRRIPARKTSKKIPKTVMAKNPELPGNTTGNGTAMEVTPELPTAEFKKMNIATPTKSVRKLPATGNHNPREAATPTDLTPKSPELPLSAGDYDRVMVSTELAAADTAVAMGEWSSTADLKLDMKNSSS